MQVNRSLIGYRQMKNDDDDEDRWMDRWRDGQLTEFGI